MPRCSPVNHAVAVAALLLLPLAGCGSGETSTSTSQTKAPTKATTTSQPDDADGGEKFEPRSVDECVDRMVAVLNAIDFDDPAEAAAAGDVVGEVVGSCQDFDMAELQTAMDERQDELSEGAHEFAYGSGPTGESAAGLPCVEVAAELPAGSPDVPMPVGEVPDRLVVEDVEQGGGAEVKASDTLTVDYIGVACSTGEIFDSSYSRGEPAEFPLDGVIAGWSEGLVGMKVGGTRLLVIPADMAYGDAGSPPAIAPGEALVFVVELHDVSG